MTKPCIICVAITGSVPTKADNPAVWRNWWNENKDKPLASAAAKRKAQRRHAACASTARA